MMADVCESQARRAVAALSALLVSGVLATWPPPTQAQGAFDVTWAAGLISVSAHDAPLAEVLRRVGELTGVEFEGLDEVNEPCSVTFTNKWLVDGLRRVLGDRSYIMARNGGDVGVTPGIRVWLNTGSTRTRARPRVRESALAAGTLEPGDGWEVGEEQPDPELERLEQSRFFEEMSDGILLEAVTSSPNERVRVRALEALNARSPGFAVNVLERAMVGTDAALAGTAAVLMAENDDPGTVESLGRILRHPEPAVRLSALEMLAQREDPSVLDYIAEAMNDDDEVIRHTARRLQNELSQVTNAER